MTGEFAKIGGWVDERQRLINEYHNAMRAQQNMYTPVTLVAEGQLTKQGSNDQQQLLLLLEE